MNDRLILLIRLEDHFAYGAKCNAVPRLAKYPTGTTQVTELYSVLEEDHIDSLQFSNGMMLLFNGNHENGEAPYNWLATGVRAIFQAKGNIACLAHLMPIMGNAAIVGINRNGDMCGLTEEQAKKLAELMVP